MDLAPVQRGPLAISIAASGSLRAGSAELIKNKVEGTTTVLWIIDEGTHVEAGEKLGLIKIKLYRPFPEEEIRQACRAARKLGVLDRNYAAGLGGIFWQDLRATFQGRRDDLLIQDYLTGICGGDVTPQMLEEVLSDLAARDRAGRPVWMGIEAAKEVH